MGFPLPFLPRLYTGTIQAVNTGSFTSYELGGNNLFKAWEFTQPGTASSCLLGGNAYMLDGFTHQFVLIDGVAMTRPMGPDLHIKLVSLLDGTTILGNTNTVEAYDYSIQFDGIGFGAICNSTDPAYDNATKYRVHISAAFGSPHSFFGEWSAADSCLIHRADAGGNAALPEASYTQISGSSGTLSGTLLAGHTQLHYWDAPASGTFAVNVTGATASVYLYRESDEIAVDDHQSYASFNSALQTSSVTVVSGTRYTIEIQNFDGSSGSVSGDYLFTATQTGHTGLVTITGTAAVGQTLSVNTSSLVDTEGLGTFSYVWKNDLNATIGTAATLPLMVSHVGRTITVTVSYTDGVGGLETSQSVPTAFVADFDTSSTGGVVVTGTPQVGNTLTTTSTVADPDGITGGITYNWKNLSGTILQAGSGPFLLTSAHLGMQITNVFIYTDSLGHTITGGATPTSVVVNPPAPNTAPTGTVTISGSPISGQTLTAVTSGLADANGLGTFSYAWKNLSDTVLGTASTLLLNNSHAGMLIRVTVSYTDGAGYSESVTSAQTSGVTIPNTPPTGTVTISGAAQEGQTLTASNNLADVDGLGTITYTWKDNLNVTQGTGPTLALTGSHVGKTIRVLATYTDGLGASETVPSAYTSTVAVVGTVDVDAPLVSTRSSGSDMITYGADNRATVLWTAPITGNINITISGAQTGTISGGVYSTPTSIDGDPGDGDEYLPVIAGVTYTISSYAPSYTGTTSVFYSYQPAAAIVLTSNNSRNALTITTATQDYIWTAPNSGLVVMQVSNAGGAPTIPTISVAGVTLASSITISNDTRRVGFTAVSGTVYTITIGRNGSSNTTFVETHACPKSATSIPLNSVSYAGDTFGTGSKAFTWTAPSDGTTTFTSSNNNVLVSFFEASSDVTDVAVTAGSVYTITCTEINTDTLYYGTFNLLIAHTPSGAPPPPPPPPDNGFVSGLGTGVAPVVKIAGNVAQAHGQDCLVTADGIIAMIAAYAPAGGGGGGTTTINNNGMTSAVLTANTLLTVPNIRYFSSGAYILDLPDPNSNYNDGGISKAYALGDVVELYQTASIGAVRFGAFAEHTDGSTAVGPRRYVYQITQNPANASQKIWSSVYIPGYGS